MLSTPVNPPRAYARLESRWVGMGRAPVMRVFSSASTSNSIPRFFANCFNSMNAHVLNTPAAMKYSTRDARPSTPGLTGIPGMKPINRPISTGCAGRVFRPHQQNRDRLHMSTEKTEPLST